MNTEAPQISFDPSKTDAVTCTNCGNHTFIEGVFLRKVSALVSPNGKAGLLPIPCYLCGACGIPADETIPNFMRMENSLPTPETPTLTNGNLKLHSSEDN